MLPIFLRFKNKGPNKIIDNLFYKKNLVKYNEFCVIILTCNKIKQIFTVFWPLHNNDKGILSLVVIEQLHHTRFTLQPFHQANLHWQPSITNLKILKWAILRIYFRLKSFKGKISIGNRVSQILKYWNEKLNFS